MDRSSHRDNEDSRHEDKSRKGKEEFKCGESRCNKLYHSYTAFYNHCKKSHNGQFPPGSLLNGALFDGPTKNRGRPRIKKSQVKNQFQIESMKAENQLIEFLGTIKNVNHRGNQQLISYVEDPEQRLEEAIAIVKQWLKDEGSAEFLQSLTKANQIICQNDLPQFYDPIEFEQYKDRVDSYNFNSIFKFFKARKDDVQLETLLICWLTRILSLKLLSETIYVLAQRQTKSQIEEKELFEEKSKKFLDLVDNYLQLIEGENIQNGAETSK